jgi:hypothetical protein
MVDQTDRVDSLFKIFVTGRVAGSESRLPSVKELEELADLGKKGVIRDLDMDEEILTGTAALALDCLREALDKCSFVEKELPQAPTGFPGISSGLGGLGRGATKGLTSKGGFVTGGTNGGKPMTVTTPCQACQKVIPKIIAKDASQGKKSKIANTNL